MPRLHISRLAFRLFALLLLPAFASAQITVSTYAGSGATGLLDGDTLTARFNQPSDIDRDPFGNHIIVDMMHVIRKISPNGTVSTLAGNGTSGYLDGPGSIARINGALNACIDSVGNIYFSDFANQRIRKIDTAGIVSTIAGSGIAGYKDTTALQARFNYPRGICMDRHGNLYISDSWNHRIRKLDPLGNVTTFAGGGNSMGVQSPGDHVDGPDTSARFWTPCGLEIDSSGNLYLADAYNHRIRRIDPQGMVSTLAGGGVGGSANGDYLDGPGAAARFNTPTGLGVGRNGDIFVADTYNNCIRQVLGGNVFTTAGSTAAGYLDGSAAQALMNHPRSALMDPYGSSLYIPDGNNHVLRRVFLSFSANIGPIATEAKALAYPNPAAETIHIHPITAGLPQSLSLSSATLCIFDITGAQVHQIRDYRPGTALSIAHLPSGLYIARLLSEDQHFSTRFLKP